jgi:hypothetical protein
MFILKAVAAIVALKLAVIKEGRKSELTRAIPKRGAAEGHDSYVHRT